MNLIHHLHDFDVPSFAKVANDFGDQRFGYVVTPNVDHMIRYYDDAHFRTLYGDAEYVLLDSRFLAYLLRAVKGMRIKVCPGSDLTAHLIKNELQPEDRVVLIGCSEQQAQKLAATYNLRGLKHFNPPMGFIKSPEAVEEALQFVERHSPFRYCLLAVGSPQQEIFAQKLKERGVAKGLGLCVGASINFLTGAEQRAPVWMQKAGLEWAFRLGQDPKRLAKRYLVRGPRIFKLLRELQFELRPAPALRDASASLITAAGVETQLPEST
jgi:exopolysaccharide biosynthesis WecB/TagA/CpsF family protein